MARAVQCDVSNCCERAYSVVRFPSGLEVPYCLRHLKPHRAYVVRVLPAGPTKAEIRRAWWAGAR